MGQNGDGALAIEAVDLTGATGFGRVGESRQLDSSSFR